MRKFIPLLLFFFLSFWGSTQTIGPYTIYDWLVSAVHPDGCTDNYVTGPPNDSTWVNFSNGDVTTGLFGNTHVDGPGVDIVIETSYNTDNYNVRLMLQGGGFSNVHNVVLTDWITIPSVFWSYLYGFCGTGASTSQRRYVDLDFITNFGLNATDVVEGIEITFLTSAGAPDLAGVYITQNTITPCDTTVFGNDTTLCTGEVLLLDATEPSATYLWQDGTTNPTYNVNTSGIYWVEVTELCGTYIDSIEVNYAPPIPVNLGADTTICSGSSFTLDATFPGSTYLWQDVTTNPTFTVNGQGTFWVDVSANGCTASDTINVSVQSTPSVNLGADTILCQGATLLLDATSPGVSYNWQDGSTNSSYLVNSPGTYWVEVSDACGSNSDTIVVDYFSATINLGNDTLLCDGSTLLLDATTIGATSYLWQDGSVNATFNVTQAGLYSVAVTAGTCVIQDTIQVDFNAPVTLTTSVDTVVCDGTDLTLSASATNGASFLYYWDMTSDTGPNQTVTINGNTSYSVYAENEHGCLSSIETINVTVFDLSGDISPASTICFGEQVTLAASAAGGNGPYTFDWSNGTTIVDPTSTVITVSPADTTQYTVTITDGCNSTLVLTTDVFVAPLPQPSYLVTNPDQCDPAIFEILNTTDPNQVATIEWIINGTQVVVNQNVVYTEALGAGSYPIQMTVVSNAGCTNTVYFDNALVVEAPPIANFTWTPGVVTTHDPDVSFVNNSVNAVSYEWFFESGVPSSSTLTDPSASFPSNQSGSFETMLIAYSDLGCSDTAIYFVEVLEESNVFAPNAFTPNGDEFNNVWRVYVEGYDLYNFNLQIFNRWGELIWENNDPSIGWDGSYQGKIVPSGTYTWVIQTKAVYTDEKVTFNGHVNVLR